MGSFVENSLITGEKIESKAIISWLSQFWLFVWSVVLCFTIIAPIFFILVAIINVVTTELAVTNKKVIGKAGFIRRESIDLPLTKLESINIDQGIIGRILGFGRVTIRGIGGNNVSIPFIKDPMSFRRVVMNLMDQKNSNEIAS
ncbi:PH domain-containing protein [Herbaspirillum rubrisubalbicans]|uniref:YdbS-like PH domain-containing protein n=1 Tax=Herbaspirillum rubrisubalbicans TaxID=80842 RepID=A0ABX9BYQ7_9BURK|nr:PH domain-containing protein [Herbaspirillum rubrisubalbicans]RAM63156.1 hypothetical protein RB24_17690 [Herbaspirillum rubrisubalbicans]